MTAREAESLVIVQRTRSGASEAPIWCLRPVELLESLLIISPHLKPKEADQRQNRPAAAGRIASPVRIRAKQWNHRRQRLLSSASWWLSHYQMVQSSQSPSPPPQARYIAFDWLPSQVILRRLSSWQINHHTCNEETV